MTAPNDPSSQQPPATPPALQGAVPILATPPSAAPTLSPVRPATLLAATIAAAVVVVVTALISVTQLGVTEEQPLQSIAIEAEFVPSEAAMTPTPPAAVPPAAAADPAVPNDPAQPTTDPVVPIEPAQPEATLPPEPTPTSIPTPVPTATATPTPEPMPTVTSIPVPTPLPTAPPGVYDPLPVAAGLVTVPQVGGITFELDGYFDVLQIPGHTLIYVDASVVAEVDLFEAAATAAGAPLNDFGAVIDYVETDPTFAQLVPLGSRTIGGHPAWGYAGTAPQLDRGFVTNFGLPIDAATWYTPTQLQIWFVDSPDGVLAITAEADPGERARFLIAIDIADRIASSLSFTSG